MAVVVCSTCRQTKDSCFCGGLFKDGGESTENNPETCEPTEGNEPVEDSAYQCSIAVRTQAAVDRGRRVNHRLGYRPYRVFLVWQRRNRRRDFKEFKRIELMPVRIVALDNIDLDLSQAGLQAEGGIKLREVSPQQVTEDDLRGLIEGKNLTSPAEEFFYEIVLHQRCPEGVKTRRRRFYVGSEPYLKADDNEFRIGLVDQEIARDREGNDRSIADDSKGPRIVT